MITQMLHYPYCHETDIVEHGLSPEGKQRYRCRTCLEGRGPTFCWSTPTLVHPLRSSNRSSIWRWNASGIRDTARVLHVSPTTVIKELKKTRLPRI